MARIKREEEDYSTATLKLWGYNIHNTNHRVITTLWEDEQTLCYGVSNNGITVLRRADNDMVNGTKLLNVTGMTRGRRDGILKNEHERQVVKVGSMFLKGVWIPLHRGQEIARREGVEQLLYPLFVRELETLVREYGVQFPVRSAREIHHTNPLPRPTAEYVVMPRNPREPPTVAPSTTGIVTTVAALKSDNTSEHSTDTDTDTLVPPQPLSNTRSVQYDPIRDEMRDER